MAVMYDNLGQMDSAIDEYNKALKVDFKNPSIHLNLASCYIKKNQISKAVDELGLAVNFDPEAVEPHAILGLLYSLQDKPEEANREYEIALKNASKLEPKNIEIYKSLGAVYLRQNKLKDAENVYSLIIDLSPDDAEAHFYLGGIYYDGQKKEPAEKELKKALALKPDYHEALNYLGYIYIEENRNLDEAEAMIKKALELQPDNGAYVDSLGWLYFKKGKLEAARAELDKAAGLIDDPIVFDHLGEVCFKLGDNKNAQVYWEKSLQLEPGQNSIKEKIEQINPIKNANR